MTQKEMNKTYTERVNQFVRRVYYVYEPYSMANTEFKV